MAETIDSGSNPRVAEPASEQQELATTIPPRRALLWVVLAVLGATGAIMAWILTSGGDGASGDTPATAAAAKADAMTAAVPDAATPVADAAIAPAATMDASIPDASTAKARKADAAPSRHKQGRGGVVEKVPARPYLPSKGTIARLPPSAADKLTLGVEAFKGGNYREAAVLARQAKIAGGGVSALGLEVSARCAAQDQMSAAAVLRAIRKGSKLRKQLVAYCASRDVYLSD
jgi:hypothetical protein